jgi:hypothetical protein
LDRFPANARVVTRVVTQTPRPTTKFTVSFVVDRKPSADRWIQVAVLSPVRRRDCENEETAVITYAPKGATRRRRAAASGQEAMVRRPKNVYFLSKRVGNYQYNPSWMGMLIGQLWVR